MTSTDVLSGVGYKCCSLELNNPLQTRIVCLRCTDREYLIMQKPAAFSKLLLVTGIDIQGILFLPHLFFVVSVYSRSRVHVQPVHG